jgi:hypothetical protein
MKNAEGETISDCRFPIADWDIGSRAFPGAVREGVFFDVEADFGLGLGRRGGELADGVEERANAGVVALNLALQLGEFVGEFTMQGQGLAQADKHAHDGDVDLNGARAAQDAREHGYAFL